MNKHHSHLLSPKIFLLLSVVSSTIFYYLILVFLSYCSGTAGEWLWRQVCSYNGQESFWYSPLGTFVLEAFVISFFLVRIYKRKASKGEQVLFTVYLIFLRIIFLLYLVYGYRDYTP